VIYVFTPAAAIEFHIDGPTAKFADHTTAFASVVNSFRAAGHVTVPRYGIAIA
jgi:hypothetical protein